MKYHIRISLRHLIRDKGFTILNIISLTLGISSALLILLFLLHETSYDRYHSGYQNVYTVGTDMIIFDQQQGYAVSSAAIVPALVKEFDCFSSYLRIFHPGYFLQDVVYYTKHQSFFDNLIFAVDNTFFDFFSVDFIEGSKDLAFSDTMSFVITCSLAMEQFGRTNITGEEIRFADSGVFIVSAVIEDPPVNTHFQYSGLFTIDALRNMPDMFERSFGYGFSWETFENTYGSTVVWSYLKVCDGFKPEDFLEHHWEGFHAHNITGLISQRNFDLSPIFRPLASIHLGSDLIYELSSERDELRIMNRDMVVVFFLVALFIILVVAINYTNLAISRFYKKRKEMALIRIVGGGSGDLLFGFLTESFATVFAALLASLVIVEIIILPINEFLNLNLQFDLFNNRNIFMMVLGVFILTSLLGGFFPALYFVTTPVSRLLISRFHIGKKTTIFKRVLIGLQFSVAAFMLVATVSIYSQFNFMQNINPGYTTQGVTSLEIHARSSKERIMVLDSILNGYSVVTETALTNYIFTMYPIKHTGLFEGDEGYTVRSFNNIQTSQDYLNLMGVQVFTDPGITTGQVLLENDNLLVNMALADSLNYDWAVGKSVVTHYQFLEGRIRRERKIAGVVQDFHYALFNRPVEPLVVLPMPNKRARYLVVKFDETDITSREAVIRDAWSRFDPENPLRFLHLEESVDAFFGYTRSLSRFFSYFALLCVIISFIGVYGITALNIEQKKTEIAIRKVLGASNINFFIMFFRQYAVLYLVGCCLGAGAG